MSLILRSFRHILSACESILQVRSSPPDLESEMRCLLDDLESVEKTLVWIKAALNDAEERAVRGEELVRVWLTDLHHLAYRGSDLLGLYEYQVIAHEVSMRELAKEKASSSSMPSKRKLDQVHDYSSSPLSDPSFREEFVLAIRKFREDLHEVNKRKENFRFEKEDSEVKRLKDVAIFEHQPTGSEPVDDVFIGRETKLQELLSLLTDEMNEDDNNTVPVIALVGMGGVGKTTLTQHVFNHADVGKHFSTKGWVCVSDDFDVPRLTRTLLEALKVNLGSDNKELSTLQGLVKEKVRQDKFLLVLDDVWNEDVQPWETFYSCLRHGAKGSMIVITTRSHNVARVTQPMRCIDVNCLSKEDAWDLFQKNAFANHTKYELKYPRLLAIGKDIATKCKGLPLAIKVLGRFLRHEYEDEDIWKRVLESDLWDKNMWGEGKQVLGPLSLSYLHLPTHLRPCFVILSVFSKDEIIKKVDLVNFWIAHDLVEDENKDKGMRYIKNLLSRSFLLPAKSDDEGNERVMMHDLMHDLAEYLSRDKVFRDVDKQMMRIYSSEADRIHIHIPHDVHHAVVGELDCADPFVYLSHNHNYNSSLRTLKHGYIQNYKWALESAERLKVDGLRVLTYGERQPQTNLGFVQCHLRSLRNLRILNVRIQVHQPSNMVIDAICKLHNLHVLILGCSFVIKLPEAIGNLRHLTYLHITGVHHVPESMSHLKKLHTLILPLARITHLPECISKLVNLEEVHLRSSLIKELPEWLGKLKGLTVLSLSSCNKLMTLPISLLNLSNLKKLDITGTSKVCYFPSGIRYMTQLRHLPLFRVAPITSGGKHAGIEELRDLVCTDRWFRIEGLCNLVSQEDAAQAELINRADIMELVLDWSKDENNSDMDKTQTNKANCQVATLDEQVLENLRPHVNLEQLKIIGWRGKRLSSWLGDESFTKLREIHLLGLASCTSLNPLQHLPSLTYLRFNNMPSLLYLTPTSSLLSPCCDPDTSTGDSKLTRRDIFPMLETLTIGYGCSRLTSLDAVLMSSMKSLEINDCIYLTSIPPLPQIESLRIWQFSGQLDHLDDSLLFLEYLTMSRCDSSWCIPLHKLLALQEISVRTCPNMWFPDSTDTFPSSLRRITIRDSPRLKEWCFAHRKSKLAHFQKWSGDVTSGWLDLEIYE